MYKKIVTYIDCEDLLEDEILTKGHEIDKNGGDSLYLYNFTKDERKREEFHNRVKSLIKNIDIPIFIGVYIKRFEDVKKALYTGATYCVIPHKLIDDDSLIHESLKRFGSKIMIEVSPEWIINNPNIIMEWKELSLYGFMLDMNNESDEHKLNSLETTLPYMIKTQNVDQIVNLLKKEEGIGVAVNFDSSSNLFQLKEELAKSNILLNQFKSSISYKDFKLNSQGLIPVITTDYKTGEVLMLAYMNEEAFYKTIRTGKMTYYSRSRNELWIKGSTSGHYQYVMSLDIDCDRDTLLAKVKQIGPACHTGSKSCFYTNLVKREYHETNPMAVLNQVYSVIKDRKENPKEGSYTNYLFDKGIDKILKKCGEEATEIIIAAKNPDSEELKYEISDFLYHMMVLMVQTGLDLDDIMKELSNR